MGLRANVQMYLGDRDHTARAASFDYCHNYFVAHRADFWTNGMLELSSLHLAAYLASWGMYRGSAPLLQLSIPCYVPLIEVLRENRVLFDLDVCDFDNENSRALVVNCFDSIQVLDIGASTTLATKIMLGVFGCVPALDRFVGRELGFGTINHRNLISLYNLYDENRAVIDDLRIPTLSFSTGAPSRIRYKQAKIIDMHAFIAGGGA
jgi:hypothetical protein